MNIHKINFWIGFIIGIMGISCILTGISNEGWFAINFGALYMYGSQIIMKLDKTK